MSKAVRDGKRNNDAAKVMRELARGLADDEVASLAAYAATLKR